MNYPAFLESLDRYVEAHRKYAECRADVHRDGPETLRLLRSLCGDSVRKFSRCLGVTPSYLSKAERGLEQISPELARRILEIQGSQK